MKNEQILLTHLSPIQYESKTSLMIKTGFSDRTLRKTVENLRRSGHLIVSSDDCNTNGYKIASTSREIELLKHLYKRRIKTELETLIAMFGNADIGQWLRKEQEAIKNNYVEDLKKIISEKKCVDCGQCKELDGVCVYDIEGEGF